MNENIEHISPIARSLVRFVSRAYRMPKKRKIITVYKWNAYLL